MHILYTHTQTHSPALWRYTVYTHLRNCVRTQKSSSFNSKFLEHILQMICFALVQPKSAPCETVCCRECNATGCGYLPYRGLYRAWEVWLWVCCEQQHWSVKNMKGNKKPDGMQEPVAITWNARCSKLIMYSRKRPAAAEEAQANIHLVNTNMRLTNMRFEEKFLNTERRRSKRLDKRTRLLQVTALKKTSPHVETLAPATLRVQEFFISSSFALPQTCDVQQMTVTKTALIQSGAAAKQKNIGKFRFGYCILGQVCIAYLYIPEDIYFS